MKSYSDLWEKFISEDNIRLAARNAAKGSKSRHTKKKIRKVRDNTDAYIEKIISTACHFKNGKHNPKIIYDGISRKKRTIIVPNYMEQIIHHMAVNVLKPIFMKGMYYHSNGSIPGRGAHKGKRYIEKWIRKDARNCKYILKMDIRKYFDSVSQDILKEKLRRIIKDERFLEILFEIIEVCPSGIPLGFYTSQWFANFFLQDMDHFIKEECYSPHYMRYMDDIVIFGANKKKLHKTKEAVERYCDGIDLKIKDDWQVFRFDYVKNGKHYGRPLDFMGFVFFRERTVLRKKILLRATRKAKRIFKKDKITWYDATQMISYLGWFSHSDSYGCYKKYIKPAVNIRNMKRKVSTHARRLNNDIRIQNSRRISGDKTTGA